MHTKRNTVRHLYLALALVSVGACKTRTNSNAAESLSTGQADSARFTVFDPAEGASKLPQAPADRASCDEVLAQLAKSVAESSGALRAHVYVGLVPEQWGRTSRLIQTVYYSLEHLATPPHTPPVLFFEGGPGSTVDGYLIRLFVEPAAYAKTDFIITEYRGVGCSSAHPPTTDFAVAEAYTSQGVVRDAEALRHFLIDDQRWVIFAQSYGTVVAYRYLENFPGSIASVITHGYAPGLTSLDERGYRALGDTRTWKSFLLTYPGARPKYDALVAGMTDYPDKPILDADGKSIHPQTVINEYAHLLPFFAIWRSVAKKLGDPSAQDPVLTLADAARNPSVNFPVTPTTTTSPEDAAQNPGAISMPVSTSNLSGLSAVDTAGLETLAKVDWSPNTDAAGDADGLGLTDDESIDYHWYTVNREMAGAPPDYFSGDSGCAGYLSNLAQTKFGSTRSDIIDTPWRDCAAYARQLQRGKASTPPTNFFRLALKAVRQAPDLSRVRANLSKINGAVYLYLSTFDPVTPPEAAWVATQALTGATSPERFHYQTLKRSGHDGFFTEPEVLATVVAEALANAQR